MIDDASAPLSNQGGLTRRQAIVAAVFTTVGFGLSESVLFSEAASAEPVWWHPFRTYAWVGDGFYATGEFWHPYNPPGQHKALDLDGGDTGEPVYAAANGVVQQAGLSSISGLGNTVEINHGGGFVTLYAHLSSTAVSVNQTVVGGGTLIGAMGGTGGDYAPHTHVEVWTGSSRSARVDPAPRIGAPYAPLALSAGAPRAGGDEMRMIQHPNGSLAIISPFYAAEYGAGDAVGSSANQKAWGDFIPVSAAEYSRLLSDAQGRRAALLAEIAAL